MFQWFGAVIDYFDLVAVKETMMTEIPKAAIEAALKEIKSNKEGCLGATVCCSWPCKCIEDALQAAAPFMQWQSKAEDGAMLVLAERNAELMERVKTGTFADGIEAAAKYIERNLRRQPHLAAAIRTLTPQAKP